MKKLSVIMAAVLLAVLLPMYSYAQDLNAESYVVMEVKSGKILYSKDADVKMWPASTTKIMTCALTLLNFEPASTQMITESAVAPIEWDTSHIALSPGEIVPVRDLLYATMIHSANDAANALAEYNSGNMQEFAKLMNKTAASIGCENTTLQNASGLFDENHRTTTHDLANITRWALSIPGFRELFGTTQYTMQPTNLQPDQRHFWTRNQLMSNTPHFYQGNCGGKTGWLPESGHTLSTLTEKDGMELICVLFNTPEKNQIYQDASKLLDKAFAEYEMMEFSTDTLYLQSVDLLQEGMQVGSVNFLNESISFPIPKGLSLGEVKANVDIPQSYATTQEIAPSVSFVAPDGSILYRHELQFETNYFEMPALSALKATTPIKPIVIPDRLLAYMVACIFLVTAMTIYYNHRYAKIERQYQQRAQRRAANRDRR